MCTLGLIGPDVKVHYIFSELSQQGHIRPGHWIFAYVLLFIEFKGIVMKLKNVFRGIAYF